LKRLPSFAFGVRLNIEVAVLAMMKDPDALLFPGFRLAVE